MCVAGNPDSRAETELPDAPAQLKGAVQQGVSSAWAAGQKVWGCVRAAYRFYTEGPRRSSAPAVALEPGQTLQGWACANPGLLEAARAEAAQPWGGRRVVEASLEHPLTGEMLHLVGGADDDTHTCAA